MIHEIKLETKGDKDTVVPHLSSLGRTVHVSHDAPSFFAFVDDIFRTPNS